MFKGPFTKLLTRPKPKLWDYQIHMSLCIHRNIDAMALDSMINMLCITNPKVRVSRMMGDSLIDRARSQEATSFLLGTSSDVLFFVDDDISYTVEDALKVCKAAYDCKGIVGATYLIKKEENSWISSKPLNNEPIYFKDDAPLTEVKWLSTGFLAIHMNVLTDMVDELKLPLCHPKDLKFYPFFLPMLWQHPNGDWLELSEDWAFCERARQIGYKIWLDPSIRLKHAGRYVYKLEDLCRPPREDGGIIKYQDNQHEDTAKDLGEQTKSEIVLK